MNGRQKAGLGLVLSGLGSMLVGAFALGTADTPQWVALVLNIAATVLPSIGVLVNFPSNTNPK